MKKWLKNRKAVSPVIAALLLIAISVAAAVITYSWVMTMIEGSGSQAQTAIRVDLVSWYNDTEVTVDYGVKVTLRNTGGVAANIETLYIWVSETLIVTLEDIGYAIGPSSVQKLGFTQIHTTTDHWLSFYDDADVDNVDTITIEGDGFLPSHSYKIKLVTDNGFMVEGTYYTPSTLPTP